MEKALAVALLMLAGCTTVQPEVPVSVKVIDNEEKNSYIEILETEASEASAALISIAGTLPHPQSDIVGLTISRLSGIRQPTEEQVERYRQAGVNSGLLAKEVESAKKVKEETDTAWAIVEEVDAENRSLKEQVKLIEAQRQSDIRAKAYDDIRATCLWLGSILSLVGVGLGVASMWLGRGLKISIFVVTIGLSIVFLPLVMQDVVEAIWFKWTIGVSFGVSIAIGLWRLFHIDKEVRSKTLLGSVE